MLNEALKAKITELLPEASFEEQGQWLQCLVAPKDWLTLAGSLRNLPDLSFDYMFCLTCIDWKTHLSMVYHMTSTQFRHNLVIKVKLDRTSPAVDTVSHIWRTAELHEREVYEMFGVLFNNHPDLRLLILPDGWEGKNPLRKDFEDPINMIRL